MPLHAPDGSNLKVPSQPTLLNVQSSPTLTASASRAVSKAFVEKYAADHAGTKVIDVDLVLNLPAHINTDHLGAFFAPPEAHAKANEVALKISDGDVDQLMGADVVVLGTPMHNFSVASVMKSWINNIVRVGKTFKYNEMGAVVGLLPQKKIVIIVGSGGICSQGPMQEFEHSGKYLHDIFRFLGMTDINVIRAEGLAKQSGSDRDRIRVFSTTASVDEALH